MNATAVSFACVFIALYAAHELGDYWLQTHGQACGKGALGWAGRLACARHVATLTATKTVFVVLAALARLLGRTVVPGKGEFVTVGAPRPGHNDNPSLGTGAAVLDQSFHKVCLFGAALLISLGVA
ncbi:hypothetical protein [Actinomadura oligospora]|uniref:hypothetical protein n=1 Tax=Actinomadura oligospora TaxID=111804 RepID=UPI00047E43C9|nr:hypothetical protein [Actinomadura oligospora]